MKHSQFILGGLVALAATAHAMPTEEETRKVEPVVMELMHDDQIALKDEKKTPEEVAEAAMSLAKKADTEAAKLLLMKGAFNLYVQADKFDEAIATLQSLQTAIPDLPPANMANIISASKITGLYKVLAERRVEETRKRLTAKARPDGLLFYCTFDDESAITTPAVGPAGKIDNKPTFVPGKLGKAIKVNPHERAVVYKLPAGSMSERGCVEVWARITDPNISTLPDLCSPIFFILGIDEPKDHPEGAGGYINWNGNDGCAGAGLCGWIAGARFVCMNGRSHVSSGSVYSTLLGDTPGDWHHYAMVWDAKGLDKDGHQGLILVDNHVVATADELHQNQIAALAQYPNYLHIPINHEKFRLRRGVAIDELRIWNKPLTRFNIK